MTPWERAQIPSTNLSESIHASWLAGEGGHKKITLYDACVTDVINAYIQCTKQLGFMTGRYIGTGPDMESFLKRMSSKRSPSPCVVARVVQGAVVGTPMYEQPILYGDKETVSQKKAKGTTTTDSSHKPGYVMLSKQRKDRGRPRKIFFGKDNIQDQEFYDLEGNTTNEDIGEKDSPKEINTPNQRKIQVEVLEVQVQKEKWAIRRMPTNCVRKCFGVVQGKRCQITMQSRTPGLVGPCFWGARTYKDQSQHQWMWFCNHDVHHTSVVSRQIQAPPEIPVSWMIDAGTNLTIAELQSLVGAGFSFTKIVGDVSATESSQKRSKKWRSGISKEANKRLESAAQMHGDLLEEITVLYKRHVVFKLHTQDYYDVHIKEDPICTCPDFQRREKDKKSFLACKHLYFVYTRILGLDRNQHMIIHQPVLSERDLVFILNQPRQVAAIKK